MANHDILSEFSPPDIAHFKKDFMQMVKVGEEIDRHYGKAHHDLDILIPKYAKLAEIFNRKYKGLKIKARKTIDSFKVRLFVNERNVKDFFANSASGIPALKSIGRGAGQIDVGDAERFASFLDSATDKISISYSDIESGTSALTAVYDRKERMVEVICSVSDLLSESSAGFRICAYYALKSGFDRKIEIYGDASTFGFSNLLDEIEKREWYDRFNPRFLE
ncbi:hypothetical protein HYS31_07085 [Candidatus Woesearchaeota archaeon]|nr:hypothetical protein [Candidatus Woesearchaeota archaeon]